MQGIPHGEEEAAFAELWATALHTPIRVYFPPPTTEKQKQW